MFLNSYGDQFGDNGIGRVYLDQVYTDRLYLLEVDPPAPVCPAAVQDSPAPANDGDGVLLNEEEAIAEIDALLDD